MTLASAPQGSGEIVFYRRPIGCVMMALIVAAGLGATLMWRCGNRRQA
ncbi:hypothetical protein [Pseudaquabacterium pictum]|nr:hypothetical protein [Rubrivivax pictus]